MRLSTFVFWAIGLFAIAALGQQQLKPKVERISNYKVITGEGRLNSGVLNVKLRQDQRFTNSSAYFVSVIAIDSSTAATPDSVRTFVIKNLGTNQFTIRSLKYSSDTIKVRWMAIGQ